PPTPTALPSQRAMVACVLREGRAGGCECLFILRAERPGDVWSGHVAFPGGRQDVKDSGGDYETAGRETLEEVGLDLKDPRVFRLLGKWPRDLLFTLRSDYRLFAVGCFVFQLTNRDAPLQFRLNRNEVSACGWCDLSALVDPQCRAHW